MTIKQIGNYFLMLGLLAIVTYFGCRILKINFSLTTYFNAVACCALLRTMEK